MVRSGEYFMANWMLIGTMEDESENANYMEGLTESRIALADVLDASGFLGSRSKNKTRMSESSGVRKKGGEKAMEPRAL